MGRAAYQEGILHMMMRSEYMAFKTSEEMNLFHRRYYGEIADEIGAGRNLPGAAIERFKVALADGNTSLNSLRDYPLSWWDMMSMRLPGAAQALKARGDSLSLGSTVCILKEAARRKTERAIVESYGYKLVTRAEFEVATDKPEGLAERAAPFMETNSFVIYDPADDCDGFMIWGDFAHELASECCAHGLLDHIAETDAQARAAIEAGP